MPELPEPIGFLEEAPGVKSMARLAVLLQAIGILLLSLALAVYLVIARPPDAAVIGAFAAPLAPLAGGIWGALKTRHTGSADGAP